MGRDKVAQTKFAGPCAQGVLDTVIVPRPMSLGCDGLFVLIKDNAFLSRPDLPRFPWIVARISIGFPGLSQ